jgi:hypothetical protein
MGGQSCRADEHLTPVVFILFHQPRRAFRGAVRGTDRENVVDAQFREQIRTGAHLVLVRNGTHENHYLRHGRLLVLAFQARFRPLSPISRR